VPIGLVLAILVFPDQLVARNLVSGFGFLPRVPPGRHHTSLADVLAGHGLVPLIVSVGTLTMTLLIPATLVCGGLHQRQVDMEAVNPTKLTFFRLTA
jgi:hypothetical protein